MGFKWFVDGLLDGSLGFGGEESAGATFLRLDGRRVDDRQGRIRAVPARRGDDGADGPRSRRAYRALTREFGEPVYDRVEAPATPAEKAALAKLPPGRSRITSWRGKRSRPS